MEDPHTYLAVMNANQEVAVQEQDPHTYLAVMDLNQQAAIPEEDTRKDVALPGVDAHQDGEQATLIRNHNST